MIRAHDNERGATAVLVALSLLVLVGFSALALDGGFAYGERRGTQNAADHAALAAAWAKCHGATDAQAEQEGIESALANGFDGSASNIVVDVQPVSSGFDGDVWRATVSRVSDTNLAGAVGSDEVTVVSEAEAICDEIPWLGGYAIYADAGPGCVGGVDDTELDFAGAGKTINGGIHSNGDLKIQGSSTVVQNGPVTYVGTPDIGGGSYEPGYPKSTTTKDISPEVTMSEFLAYHAANSDVIDAGSDDITNNWIRNNGTPPYGTGSGGSVTITTPGVYYTDGDIDLNNVSLGGAAATQGVTFAAAGQIHIAGSGDITRFDDQWQMLMFSTYPGSPSCTLDEDDFAIKWSVSNGSFTGLIYAPNGLAIQSGATINATINGSIVAYQVNLAGSNYEINWTNNPNVDPEYEFGLQK